MDYADRVKTKNDMVEPQPSDHSDLRMHLVLADMKKIVPEQPRPKRYPGPRFEEP